MARILLIDDDSLMQGMLARTLEKMGHVVVTASDGKEGLRVYAPADFDLVLTDLVMPEQEGLETIRKLRAVNPAVKIIAMSGGGRGSAKDYLQVAQFMGARQVLAKPFSPAALEEALAVLLADGGRVEP